MTEPRPYRGLTKDGKWVKGDLVRSSDGRFAIIPPMKIFPDLLWKKITMQSVVEVIPETVSQSTGLKDKKNKEDVYQHDIVSCSSHSTPSVLFKGVIKWRAPEFYLACFWQKVNGDEESFPVGANNRSLIRGEWVIDEILGNIHQHPELLKGAKT